MRRWATRSAIFGSKLFEYITILRGKAVNGLIIYYLKKLEIGLKVYFWKNYFVYLMWNKLLEKLLFIILATTPMHIPLTLCMLDNFSVINCYLNDLKYMIFSSSFCRNRITLSNRLDLRSSSTFCWYWSRSQLFAKAIHSQINSPLECKELAHDVEMGLDLTF